MCSVHSALTGEVLAVVDEYEGKTAKEMKQSLADQIGVPRFRQRFLSDEFHEISNDQVFTSEDVKVQLTLLQFCEAEVEEDRKLISASRHNDLVALEDLLSRPRNPNVADTDGRSPLHYGAQNGHVEVMRLLLEAGATRDARDTKTQRATPLMLAAASGHTDSVDLLLQAGAQTDLATLADGTTPLWIAAKRGHEEVVRLLLDAGADIDKPKADTGTTPLFMAAQNGHVPALKVLLDGRADIDRARTDTGDTPLRIAAQKGNAAVLQLLLSGRQMLTKLRLKLTTERARCG